MSGGEDLLVSEERLLEQALARSYAGVADLDVTPHLKSREADQVRGQVNNADRLAHIEHEDLSAATQGARLQHQLDGLRYGHEVAAHLGMRDRERAAGADLAEEDRDD